MTTRRHVRRAAAAALGVAAAIAVVSPAPEAGAVAAAPLFPFGVATSSAAAGMTYNTAFAASTTIVVSRVGNWFLVDDTIRVVAGAGCLPIAGDNTRVWCAAPKVGAVFRPFHVFAKGGNDAVWNQTDVRMIGDGGDGNDTLVGSLTASDILDGAAGNDLVNGRGGGDGLRGGPGADRLFGLAGNDGLAGQDGNDVLDAGTGADVSDGGAGIDTVSYSTRVLPVVGRIGVAGVSGQAGEGDTITGTVENLVGGNGNDLLVGSAAPNSISGLGGHDRLYGLAGPDRLFGGTGNDLLDGGTGGDRSDGGLGVDTVTYATRVLPVVGRIGVVGVSGQAGEGDTITGTVENLVGGTGNDLLVGSAAANGLSGNGGGDRLFGLGGPDALVGGNGNDVIFTAVSVAVQNDGATDRVAGSAGIDSCVVSAPDPDLWSTCEFVI